MIEEFNFQSREAPFDPLSAILFKVLQVTAFLFFIAFLALSQQKDTGKIDTKAEFFVSMTWPDNHPDDFDSGAEPIAAVWGRDLPMVEELDERNIPSGEPRAYVLAYSAALADKAATAQAEIKKGNPQGGMRQTFMPTFAASGLEGVNVRNVSQGAMPGGDPSGGGVFDPAALGGQSKSVDLIPLPKALLPPKGDP